MATGHGPGLEALPVKAGFRLRGAGLTRLEGLTDAAFALALTYLVISLDAIPENWPALVAALKQMPAFAASFAVLLPIWALHVNWSRRYGLEDGAAIALTGVLIFAVLVFVYPLKIACASFFAWISGGWLPPAMALSSVEELRGQFVVFTGGYLVLGLAVAALYALALGRSAALALDAYERHETVTELQACLLLAATGLHGLVWSLLLPAGWSFIGGMQFSLLGVVMPVHALWRARLRPPCERLPTHPAAGAPSTSRTE